MSGDADTGDERAARPSGVAETHVSTVFFAGDRAYKLLKPLATAFLDHSRVSDRIAAARREVELNRRMAPDVYLGEADVVEHGEVVDRFIVMRRLDEARRLSSLVDDPCFDDCLRSVVKTVATFHENLEPLTNPDGPASAAYVRHLWVASLDEMAADMESLGRAPEHHETRTLAMQYIDGRTDLFQSRIAAGLQRDGHGDLLTQDIFCEDDGPRILDCLAFRDDLRISDVLDDIAFLAMDVERIAGPARGVKVIDLYSEFTNEHHPASLAHHYIAYRALVRSKVAAIRAAQGLSEQWAEAEQLHHMALEHLRAGEVRAVMVGGAPGTGKSTVAQAIADGMGWIVVSSDEVRKELAGLPHGQRVRPRPDEGLYSPDRVDATYDEMIERASHLMASGESVVLDASWTTEHQRQRCYDSAAAASARLTTIECVLDSAIAAERVARRAKELHVASDATPEVAAMLAARREPWDDALSLSTDAPPEVVAERAIELLGTASSG